MHAARAPESPEGVSLHQLRPLIGAQVAAQTISGAIVGTLVSCTTRSAWIVADDADHVVTLPSLLSIRKR